MNMFVYYLCLCDWKSRYGSLYLEVISLRETTEEDTRERKPQAIEKDGPGRNSNVEH